MYEHGGSVFGKNPNAPICSKVESFFLEFACPCLCEFPLSAPVSSHSPKTLGHR